ncbi:Tyrosine recombinase XerC [compost metagenome]
MSIKKLDDGRYEVDIRPQGADGKRIRRKFNTKGEAQIFERHTISQLHNKPWLSKAADRRKLTELLDLWWLYFGRSHARGEKDKERLTTIIGYLAEMGITRADQLTTKSIMSYRAKMIDAGLKNTSVNRHHIFLSGMFTKLVNAGEFQNDNPFRGIKRLKEQVSEMTYLTTEEIQKLLTLLEGDDLKVVLLSLATGGRWGEVSSLKAENIIGGKVIFNQTKSGRRRAVPISAELEKRIKLKQSGKLLMANYQRVRNVLKSMKPDLPDGQALHVLRHTFATHFMINGGNIITLQRILGHATIQQTMAYAHFAPDHLHDAVSRNPLVSVSIECPQPCPS